MLDNKTLKIKVRKMTEEKAFREMTEEEKEQFLEERKKQSAERYNLIKQLNETKRAKRKAFRAKVHQGNQWLRDKVQEVEEAETTANPYISGGYTVADFKISFGVIPEEITNDNVKTTIAYSIKSPTDQENKNVASGLIGSRLANKKQWTMPLTFPRDIWECSPDLVKKVASMAIDTKVILRSDEIPQRVINSLFKQFINTWESKQKQSN